MKKTIPIVAFSSALIASGGITTLSSCRQTNSHELTPQVRQQRQMNKNVPNIIVGDFRLQILDDSTVRFEYKYDNPIYGTTGWLDDDTLFVPNRTLYPGPTKHSVSYLDDKVQVKFSDITIDIPWNITKLMRGIKVYQKIDQHDKLIYDSDNQKNDNTGELPAPEETGYVYEFIDSPRIIEPILGYSEDNQYIEPYKSHWDKLGKNCGFEIQKQKDIYLTFPHNDPKALRQQYRNLAGAPEMVRLSTLGAWDSRYYPYNEQTAQEEVDNYYKYNLPLDNLVIDTDWRAGFTGKGYFINETLFPNMPRFLKSMHNQNIDVCFNDHPEPQKEDDKELPVLNPKEVEFRRSNLKKIMDMGLDTWWYDRNWSTSLICPEGTTEEDLNHETWGDYLYNNVTKQTHITQALEKYKRYGAYAYNRPTAMSNVVQIRNGKWEGFTDSASHRYSIHWTGDQTPDMLPSEVANVIKTGINGMPYMSSDLAGHTNGVASDYYYQRWIEYGALSPIFRIHCTRDLPIHCQPWLRGDKVTDVFREWINLRYRLLPLYYSLAKEAYDTGMPICRALGFNYRDIPQNARESEYLIGDNILFAPCLVNDKRMKINGVWTNPDGKVQANFYNNSELEGEPKSYPGLDYIDLNNEELQKIAQELLGKTDYFSINFKGHFTPQIDQPVKLLMRYDDGIRVTVTNEETGEVFHAEDWKGGSARDLPTDITLENGVKYSIDIDYKQHTGNCEVHMYGVPETSSESKKVWIPKGQWLDVFNGNVINSAGEWTNEIKYGADQNAIFMRLGSMIPLINNAQNTKEFDWTNLVYDVYPSNESNPYVSSLYEDDFTTVAYQNGFYHNSPYQCYYDKSKSEYVIQLLPSSGWYIGDDNIAERTYKIRFHEFEGFNWKSNKVTIDGKECDAVHLNKDENILMPFNFSGPSRTEGIVEITIPKDSVRVGHIIRIKVGA